VRKTCRAELAAATLLIFFAGTTGAEVISAGLRSDSVNIVPAFINSKKARTFMNQMRAFSGLFLITGGEFHEALIVISALLLGNNV